MISELTITTVPDFFFDFWDCFYQPSGVNTSSYWFVLLFHLVIMNALLIFSLPVSLFSFLFACECYLLGGDYTTAIVSADSS